MEEVIDLSEFLTPDTGQKGDETLRVQFYKKSVLNKLKTYGGSILDEFGRPKKDAKGDPMTYEAAGRPVYEQRDYVKITPPDRLDKHNIVERPATDADRQRFRKQYQAFQARNQKAPDGMPLEKWPLIEAHQVDELRYLGIHTVERLSNVKPGEIPDIGGMAQLVQHATDYLAAAKGSSASTQLRTELSKRDTEIDALKRQMGELIAMAQAQAQTKPVTVNRRGRPPKAKPPEALSE